MGDKLLLKLVYSLGSNAPQQTYWIVFPQIASHNVLQNQEPQVIILDKNPANPTTEAGVPILGIPQLFLRNDDEQIAASPNTVFSSWLEQLGRKPTPTLQQPGSVNNINGNGNGNGTANIATSSSSSSSNSVVESKKDDPTTKAHSRGGHPVSKSDSPPSSPQFEIPKEQSL